MMWETASPSAKLTGDSGTAFEALLIGNCRLFRFWRKVSRCVSWDFCNNIERIADSNRTSRHVRKVPTSRPKRKPARGGSPNLNCVYVPIRKSMLRKMMPGGMPSNAIARNFRAACSSIRSRSLMNYASRWLGLVCFGFSKSDMAEQHRVSPFDRQPSKTGAPSGQIRNRQGCRVSVPF